VFGLFERGGHRDWPKKSFPECKTIILKKGGKAKKSTMGFFARKKKIATPLGGPPPNAKKRPVITRLVETQRLLDLR